MPGVQALPLDLSITLSPTKKLFIVPLLVLLTFSLLILVTMTLARLTSSTLSLQTVTKSDLLSKNVLFILLKPMFLLSHHLLTTSVTYIGALIPILPHQRIHHIFLADRL